MATMYVKEKVTFCTPHTDYTYHIRICFENCVDIP